MNAWSNDGSLVRDRHRQLWEGAAAWQRRGAARARTQEEGDAPEETRWGTAVAAKEARAPQGGVFQRSGCGLISVRNCMWCLCVVREKVRCPS